MSGRRWVLAETNWDAVSETDYDVAVLPWAATEAHGYHLPYATDVYETTAVAAEAARLAWEAGARTLVLPTLPFGANAQQMEIPGTVNMHPTTQLAVLYDVIESLDVQGFDKLVVLNGHGGNDFKQMIREAQTCTPLFLSTVSWFRIPDTLDVFDEPGDHGGEAETSLMMHLHPDLVRPLDAAGTGASAAWRLAAIREGWAWAPRNWTEATEDTGVGDPSRSTAEKGRAYFELVTRRIAGYFVELARVDVDDLYDWGDDDTAASDEPDAP